jgi:hypothetical protein
MSLGATCLRWNSSLTIVMPGDESRRDLPALELIAGQGRCRCSYALEPWGSRWSRTTPAGLDDEERAVIAAANRAPDRPV